DCLYKLVDCPFIDCRLAVHPHFQCDGWFFVLRKFNTCTGVDFPLPDAEHIIEGLPYMDIRDFLVYGDGGMEELAKNHFDTLHPVPVRLIPLNEKGKYLIAASNIQQFPAAGLPFCHPPLFDRAIDSKTTRQKTFGQAFDIDRKSTRLNSSHVSISYAVF